MPNEDNLILIIDDSEENLEIISAKLTHLGYDIITAESGELGIESAQKRHPNLILLDLMLPQLDGWEVLKQLHEDPETAGIPVIIMTAYTTIQHSSERDRAMEYGAVDFFRKPFDLNEVAMLVAKHIKS